MTIQPYSVRRTYCAFTSDVERHGPNSAYQWCHRHAGVCAPDKDWHITSFCNLRISKNRTDTYKFRDRDTALMFKLLWGGR